MRTLYGTDSKHRLWTKCEYADGRIEIEMRKKFADNPVKVTPHSYKKGVVCFHSGNSFYHEAIEYINWTTEPHNPLVSSGVRSGYGVPPVLEWLVTPPTWRYD